MTGILHLENFVANPAGLFAHLAAAVAWDERMVARKTASFGRAYNYSQIHYPYQEFLPELAALNQQLRPIIGFEPNNCLLNYYLNGRSKMGYHSDQTDILEPGTGVAIVSLGETRPLLFRRIARPTDDEPLRYELTAGSLLYMTQQVQADWQYAIPRTATDHGRISLTFRQMR